MAETKNTTTNIIPFPADGLAAIRRTAGAYSSLATCAYCERELKERVIIDRRPYCNRLCAAFGLIRDVDYENCFEEAEDLTSAIKKMLEGDELVIPLLVRDSDMDAALREFSGRNVAPIVITDDSQPDWQPGSRSVSGD